MPETEFRFTLPAEAPQAAAEASRAAQTAAAPP